MKFNIINFLKTITIGLFKMIRSESKEVIVFIKIKRK